MKNLMRCVDCPLWFRINRSHGYCRNDKNKITNAIDVCPGDQKYDTKEQNTISLFKKIIKEIRNMLDNVTTKELEDELRSRYKELKRRRESIPKPLRCGNLESLHKRCKSYLEYICNYGLPNDEDMMYSIFMAAMEGLYGKKVWDWINSFDKGDIDEKN